jgi:hypothetical protein
MTMGEQQGRGGIPPSNVASLNLHLNLNLLSHQGQSRRSPCHNHRRHGCHGNRDRECRRSHLQTQHLTWGPHCLAPVRYIGRASSRDGRSGSQLARPTPPRGRQSMGTSHNCVPRIFTCHCSWSCCRRFFAVGVVFGVVVVVAANANTAAQGWRGGQLAIVAAILRLVIAVIVLISAIAIAGNNNDKDPIILLCLALLSL